MKKILLTFMYNYNYNEEYEEIVSQFENRNYDVHSFEGIELNNFPIYILPDILKQFQDQYEGEISFSIISNIREVITVWYRVYNQLIDKFIYLIDDIELSFTDIESQDFLKSLSSFNGINNELKQISKKIYLNINSSNYKGIIDFLSSNLNYQYFDDLLNMDYDDIKLSSCEFYKLYIFNEYQYCFPIWDIETKHEVIIDSNNTILNKESSSIIKFTYYIYILLIFYLQEKDLQKLNILLEAINKLLNKKDKLYLEKKFKEYITNNSIDFPNRLRIASLLATLKSKDSLDIIFKILKEDYEYINLHYGMLYNILCYISHNLFDYNKNYLEDMSMELDKIMAYYLGNMKLENKKTYNENGDIVIITDQLLSLRHSPSKLVLDFCKELSKLYNDREIYLFVEDSLTVRQDEISLLHVFSSANSISIQYVHKDYIKNHSNIKIIYTDTNKIKFERTKEFVYQIMDINPKVILSFSNISITSRILYDYYPTVYYTMGSVYQIAKCDVFIANQKVKSHGIYDKNLTYFVKPAYMSINKTGNVSRHNKQFNNEDFIMVTVGNRLEGEISDDYFLLIYNFLKQYKKAKWVIIGEFNLEDRFNRLSIFDENKNRIINMRYEKELQDFYSICDIYINPDRVGGGFSIAMAMDEELPIVNYSRTSAGLVWIGEENCCGSSDDEYIQEIKRLYNDEEYKKIKGKLMKKLIKECRLEEQINKIYQLFSVAIERYYSRRKVLSKYE